MDNTSIGSGIVTKWEYEITVRDKNGRITSQTRGESTLNGNNTDTVTVKETAGKVSRDGNDN